MDKFTPEQIDTSMFPPVEFFVKSERFAWFAPMTPGIGYNLLVMRWSPSDAAWVPFYSNGRDLTIAEFADRGGVKGFALLHVKEVNHVLSVHFKSNPEAAELDRLVAELVEALKKVKAVGTALVLDET